MFANQITFKNNEWKGWDSLQKQPADYQLVLVMGDKELVADAALLQNIRDRFPSAHIPVLSTAGEIWNDEVHEQSLVAIAIYFENTPLKVVEKNWNDFKDSHQLGVALAEALPQEDLSYAMVLSCGSLVNGEDLIHGITDVLGNELLITGGMAGDGDRFQSTMVGCADHPKEGTVVLIGFYGEHLKVSSGVKSGWTYFGPERTVTRSEKNVLYSIDDENALELYKRYLGEFANQLPSSALFFPLAILSDDTDVALVRTILSVDNTTGSMTFAGNIPEGARVRLMRTNTEQIINNAGMAGTEAGVKNQNAVLALAINCIGRKLVLGPMANTEIQSIKKNITPQTLLAGFYSYGEFSGFFRPVNSCELHNQTVVLTLFDEC